MPTAASARLALTAPLDAEANDVPADLLTLIGQLEVRVGVFLSGLYAALPAAAAGNARGWYLATDALAVFYSDGATWTPSGGIVAMSTATRDALVAGGKWVGRIIENTTTAQPERWTGSAWATVGTAPDSDQAVLAAQVFS